jgi:hypothetical protein
VRDVAVAIAHSLEMGRIGAFYITRKENLTYQEFFRKVTGIVSQPESKILIPDWQVKSVGALGSLSGKILNIKPGFTYPVARLFCVRQFVSIDAAMEEAKYNLHVALIYAGNTEIDEGKKTIAADGTKMVLKPRMGRGVYSKESVARAVAKNISKRKFVTVLTFRGKLTSFLQPLFPIFVERLIIRNLPKFEEGFK